MCTMQALCGKIQKKCFRRSSGFISRRVRKQPALPAFLSQLLVSAATLAPSAPFLLVVAVQVHAFSIATSPALPFRAA
eukprot:m.276471 g.276471  ORF g.276471 m.276471 type:complete len:78 (-) comp15713_c0_seq20:1093-1326(-)